MFDLKGPTVMVVGGKGEVVRGQSDDARLKGPTRGGGGLGDLTPGVPRGQLPYLTQGCVLDLPV